MRHNYRINSYTFHATRPGERFSGVVDNLYYLVDPELHYLLTVWSETVSGCDNDLSGVVADMMEERPPHFKSARHKTAWRILREFMLAVFAHRDRWKPRPSFSLPESEKRRKKK